MADAHVKIRTRRLVERGATCIGVKRGAWSVELLEPCGVAHCVERSIVELRPDYVERGVSGASWIEASIARV